MKIKIAKFIVSSLGLTGFYFLLIVMKCWTPDCMSDLWHWDLFLIVIGFGLFMYSAWILLVNDILPTP